MSLWTSWYLNYVAPTHTTCVRKEPAYLLPSFQSNPSNMTWDYGIKRASSSSRCQKNTFLSLYKSHLTNVVDVTLFKTLFHISTSTMANTTLFIIIPILIAFAVESNPGEEWSPTNRSTSADGDSVQRNSTALQIAENPHEPSRKMRLAHLDYPNNLNKSATTNISPIRTGLWLSSLTDTAKVKIYPCVYIFCLCQCPCDASPSCWGTA